MPADRPLKIKIQIFCGDEIAMGPGKADLLDAIRDHGSISAAGRALGMSYRRTWLLVDAMNRCWTERLVDTVPGGGQARGATVTGTGEAILLAYRAIQAAAGEAASPVMAKYLEMLLLPTPRPSEASRPS